MSFSIKQSTKDYMSVIVTHECNMRHKFCVDKYVGKSGFFDTKHLEKVITFGKKEGIKDVLFVGGEPTLHPDLCVIIAAFKAAGFRTILTTNHANLSTLYGTRDVVDCYNVSWYKDNPLPDPKDYPNSDITLGVLIHEEGISSIKELDDFIDKFSPKYDIKFSTLTPCNRYCCSQNTDFLDSLDCEYVVLFNAILGQLYRGAVIKREDRLINHNAIPDFKVHVDGTINKTWEEST